MRARTRDLAECSSHPLSRQRQLPHVPFRKREAGAHVARCSFCCRNGSCGASRRAATLKRAPGKHTGRAVGEVAGAIAVGERPTFFAPKEATSPSRKSFTRTTSPYRAYMIRESHGIPGFPQSRLLHNRGWPAGLRGCSVPRNNIRAASSRSPTQRYHYTGPTNNETKVRIGNINGSFFIFYFFLKTIR